MKVVLFCCLLLFVACQADAFSCSMGQWACISSCNIQNCQTGYCGNDGICRCSQCDRGSVAVCIPKLTFYFKDVMFEQYYQKDLFYLF